MKKHLEHLIQTALNQLISAGSLPEVACPRIQIDVPKDKQHGDFSCNIAMLLAKPTQRKPRELAELLKNTIPLAAPVTQLEIAGPGFINFFLAPTALHTVIAEIISAGKHYGKAAFGSGRRVLIEFVSSNPTGPLHVGHGRHAAYGAVVANLLEQVGYTVHREYYVNDAGRQMDILAVSVWLRYLELLGETIVFPANAYKGSYVIDIAAGLQKQSGDELTVPASRLYADLPEDEPAGGDKEIYIDAIITRARELLGEEAYQQVLNLSLKMILADISDDLAEFGVYFDQWFSEREFTQTDVVDRHLTELRNKGLAYEKEGALWFRSEAFGDEKDRVLERANGQRTYFANDLVYHINKFERGFDLAIDIFGSDHHGYIPRMKAGLAAYGIAENKLTYLLVQFVSLYRSGVQASMSTRSGSFVTLRELRQEVGNDAARFFYVMRKCEQHMDFDLDLAKAQTNENPVYYVQYAHARICSVFRQLTEKAYSFSKENGLSKVDLLVTPHECALVNTLSRYPEVVKNAAMQHEPHLLTHYLRELANDFHTLYNSHQFLVDDNNLRDARLVLITSARQVLVNGLQLLGVSTPESM